MALVPRTIWSVTYTFRDNNGKTASTSVDLPGTIAYADAANQAVELGSRLQAVSDAALTGVYISSFFYEDAPATPPASSEVERKLRIPLGTADRPAAGFIEVPSPLFTLEIAGTDIVDQTNAALVALKDYLVNGPVGADNGAVNGWGVAYTRSGDAEIVHRTRPAKR